MPELEIRSATKEETEWSAIQMSKSAPWTILGISINQCRKSCFDPEFRLYIARCESELCGMVLVDPRGIAGSPYIKSIVVNEKFRNRGIGRQLIVYVENQYRPESRYLFLCVSSFNNGARKLYDQLGFKKVGEFEDYIIEGESEILMYKRLR